LQVARMKNRKVPPKSGAFFIANLLHALLITTPKNDLLLQFARYEINGCSENLKGYGTEPSR
jgi:hypothetical protein